MQIRPLAVIMSMSMSMSVLLGAPRAGAGDAAPLASSAEFLRTADALEVVSLDPGVHRSFARGYGPEVADPHARWLVALAEADGVHGRMTVTDAVTRAAIVDELAKGPPSAAPATGCYEPRHAVVARKGDATVAIHLCFQCQYALLLEASTTQAGLLSFGGTATLKVRLDDVLRVAKIPLAEDLEKDAAPKTVPVDPSLSPWNEPDTVDFYAIDENVYRGFAENSYVGDGAPLPISHAALASGRGVKASVALTRPGARNAVVSGIARGLAAVGDPAHCWNPRHAVVLTKGLRRVVVLLCFECSYAAVLRDDTARGMNRVSFRDVTRLQSHLDLALAAAPPIDPAYDVVLTAYGQSKLQAIRVVRNATDLGLAECKKLVESLPQPVARGLPKSEAEELVAAFACAGCTANAARATGSATKRLEKFDVVVTSVGANVDAVVDRIRAQLTTSPADLRETLKTLPATLLRNAWRGDANALVVGIGLGGGKAEIRPVVR